MIENIQPVPPVGNQASFAKETELLRDVGLPLAQVGFQVANALLAAPQQRQNLEAHGVHQGFEETGLPFGGGGRHKGSICDFLHLFRRKSRMFGGHAATKAAVRPLLTDDAAPAPPSAPQTFDTAPTRRNRHAGRD